MDPMTLRERLMTVMRGGKADRVPLTIYQWTKHDPEIFKKLQVQGFTYIFESFVYTEKHDSTVKIDIRETGTGAGRQVFKTIKTPVGELTEKAGFDPSFESRWIQEHLVKSIDDFKVMQYVYEHTSVEPAYDDFIAKDREIGEEGIVLGEILPIPVMWLMVEVIGVEVWSEGIMLHAEEFESLLNALTAVYKRQVEIAAHSPAEIIWLPDNVTGDIVSPAIFDKYCKPIYDEICPLLKQAGKLTFAHYDGINKPLKEGIREVDIDIIEAFTPPPMGDMTVAEARKAWPDKVLAVNIPGNIFYDPAEKIEAYVCEYMEQGGDEGKFSMGCTEDFPPEQFEHAFSAVIRAMKEFE